MFVIDKQKLYMLCAEKCIPNRYPKAMSFQNKAS